MAHKNSADVPFSIAGQDFTLRFSLKAQLALKDRWGLEKDADVTARLNALETEHVVDVLWAALRSHHPDMDHDDVVELLDDAEQDDFNDAMKQLLSASMPPAKEGGAGKKQKPTKS
ncbi:MAG: hypothetical protein CMB99_16510 [Flavobacteriaceae bacterium]|jgi:hypothetical protein|nr:hypothetical protein [Flavobacteriaceae bacterium]|tara:strand:- start:21771 stop:22118 length:348 start_codon:yes stop_codon:yes gene_type:complete